MLKKILCAFLLSSSALYATKEIELKISVDDGQRASLEKWLSKNAVCKGTSKQTEYYLTNPDKPWDTSKGFKDASQTLRVRCEKKGDSVCFKQAHYDPITKKRTHRDEFETKVQDGVVMLDILRSLGYSTITLVSKIRTTYLVRDTFEVVLDDVESVGKFIEIELKKPTDDVKAGLKSIQNFLKEVGITEFTEYERSYIHMMWNPGHDFGTRTFLH